jgi:poly(3-hydroxybutyrate) depolymerase
MRLLASLALSVSFSYRVEAAGTEQVDRFGRNPGKLLMFKYVPDGLAAGAPLVVALHGCNQSATDFDDESGWTEMAERLRFAVLLPGQQEANNPTRCFNFFLESDNRRGRGEAASVMAMIEAMRNQHRTDPDRTYVTGLSAGGAMTAVMLAAYPEAFRASAIFAGLPYGCASTGGNLALEWEKSMLVPAYGEAGWASYRCGIAPRGGVSLPPFSRTPREWRELLAEAGALAVARWPKVSLWHGTADRRVHPANLRELMEQWTAAHGIDPDSVADEEGGAAAYRRREYKDPGGAVQVETIEVLKMEHALPINPRSRGAVLRACRRLRRIPRFAVLGSRSVASAMRSRNPSACRVGVPLKPPNAGTRRSGCQPASRPARRVVVRSCGPVWRLLRDRARPRRDCAP